MNRKNDNTLLSRTAPNLPIRPPEKGAEKNTLPLEMKLDHNNMVKNMKGTKAHAKVTIPKLVKTTHPPPVRPYPGEDLL